MKTDGSWNLETPAEPFARLRELEARVEHGPLGRRHTGIVALPGGQVAYRSLLPGESLWARDPQRDGFDFAPPASRVRDDVYPWGVWANGRYHVAIEEEDFSCSIVSFRSGLRKKAAALGVQVSVQTQRERWFSTERRAVVFRFLLPGQAFDIFEGLVELVDRVRPEMRQNLVRFGLPIERVPEEYRQYARRA